MLNPLFQTYEVWSLRGATRRIHVVLLCTRFQQAAPGASEQSGVLEPSPSAILGDSRSSR
jgi:hypothetical protein